MVLVRIDNNYEDGHKSTATQTVRPPVVGESVEDWWENAVFPFTGDGHGMRNPKLGSLHEATVTKGPDWLVGQTKEWG